jgi:transcription-repair coupling factor (superfamily II helicase)
MTSKVRKETQEIAKELLKLYAERKAAKGFRFAGDETLQAKFEATFGYEETPGQIKAINDVKADMERSQPMDRLVCGDVGFGKNRGGDEGGLQGCNAEKAGRGDLADYYFG